MPTGTEMPRYKSHKEVWALKIAKVVPDPKAHPLVDAGEEDGETSLIPEEEGFAPVPVSGEWVRKHQPQPGGYFVVYQDGYRSYSPAKAFEEGYTLIDAENPPAEKEPSKDE